MVKKFILILMFIISFSIPALSKFSLTVCGGYNGYKEEIKKSIEDLGFNLLIRLTYDFKEYLGVGIQTGYMDLVSTEQFNPKNYSSSVPLYGIFQFKFPLELFMWSFSIGGGIHFENKTSLDFTGQDFGFLIATGLGFKLTKSVGIIFEFQTYGIWIEELETILSVNVGINYLF